MYISAKYVCGTKFFGNMIFYFAPIKKRKFGDRKKRNHKTFFCVFYTCNKTSRFFLWKSMYAYRAYRTCICGRTYFLRIFLAFRNMIFRNRTDAPVCSYAFSNYASKALSLFNLSHHETLEGDIAWCGGGGRWLNATRSTRPLMREAMERAAVQIELAGSAMEWSMHTCSHGGGGHDHAPCYKPT